jgi:hypothetical protein
MKKAIFITLAFIAVLIIACNNPKNDVKENPLQGAWEITNTKYVTPDTTIEKSQFDNPTVKLLTKKHFAFGSQSGENKIWGGGGEYSLVGDTYTEIVKYHGISKAVGMTVKYKSTLDGDLWTITRLDMNATETWKRIIE